jgi:hypothetical protein
VGDVKIVLSMLKYPEEMSEFELTLARIKGDIRPNRPHNASPHGDLIRPLANGYEE